MSTLAKIIEDMPEPTADEPTPAPIKAVTEPVGPEAGETEGDETEANVQALDAFASDPSPEEQAAVADRQLRILEALLFASSEPLPSSAFAPYVGEGADVEALLTLLAERYAARGVNLVRRGDKWAFRTAEDLGFLLRREQQETRNLSRAALETLSIIAYHQPATRAEIEEVRGVATGKGTIDTLLEAGWIRMRGRRRTPGRPVTYGTTEAFLDHFGLESLGDLPGLEELKGAGLLSGRLPPSMQIPLPFDGPLREDEDPLDEGDTAETIPEDE
jgi:segregation and condensation protein B